MHAKSIFFSICWEDLLSMEEVNISWCLETEWKVGVKMNKIYLLNFLILFLIPWWSQKVTASSKSWKKLSNVRTRVLSALGCLFACRHVKPMMLLSWVVKCNEMSASKEHQDLTLTLNYRHSFLLGGQNWLVIGWETTRRLGWKIKKIGKPLPYLKKTFFNLLGCQTVTAFSYMDWRYRKNILQKGT